VYNFRGLKKLEREGRGGGVGLCWLEQTGGRGEGGLRIPGKMVWAGGGSRKKGERGDDIKGRPKKGRSATESGVF